jgi:hypothetical protein
LLYEKVNSNIHFFTLILHTFRAGQASHHQINGRPANRLEQRRYRRLYAGLLESDSLVFVGKAAPLYGWQSTIDRYKKAYPDKTAMGQLDFTIIKLDVLDDHNAFMLGGWHLKRSIGDIGGYFTLWFKKIDGEWKIVCDHTS